MSNAPVISWFIKEPDNEYVSHTDWYAGSCGENKDLLIELEVWNNRWNNTNDCESISNAKLVLNFLNAEDSVLLLLCKIKVNNGSYMQPTMASVNRGVVSIGELSGGKNLGNYSSVNNYKSVRIEFSNIPKNFKSELKSLYLDIEY